MILKKVRNITAIILLAAVYCSFIIYQISRLPMNADAACMILESDDILSGNLFLSDWNLTGVTFLTTDLPYFIVGTAIAGVGLNAFRIAVALMFLTMVFCALLVACYGVEKKWLAMVVFAGMGLFPTFYALSNAFVHTAAFSFCFLSIFYAMRCSDFASKWNFVILGGITALSVCGDGLALVLITLPLLCLCVFRCFHKPVRIAASVIVGTFAGICMQKLYLMIGGANLNSLLHSEFIEISQLWENISLYIEYFLRLLNAYFFSTELFSITTCFYAVKIFVSLFALYIICLWVKKAVCSGTTDIPTASLGIGFCIITLLLWLTTFTLTITPDKYTTGRYIAFLPLMIGIVLARYVNAAPYFQKKVPLFFTVLISICFMMGNAASCGRSQVNPDNTFSRLAGYLQEEGLTEGYAAFWDSSVVTVYSEGEVNVRAVMYRQEALRPRRWFCKNSWYDENAQFVIIRNEQKIEEEKKYNENDIFNTRIGDGFDYYVTRENVEAFLGAPKEVKNFENYSILLYDKIHLEKG